MSWTVGEGVGGSFSEAGSEKGRRTPSPERKGRTAGAGGEATGHAQNSWGGVGTGTHDVDEGQSESPAEGSGGLGPLSKQLHSRTESSELRL